ncbi:MAG TPA: hypothetical protein VJ440_03660 [Candidatus Brocadiaceae bacterium]|nr:hypothetical protein [Candidatus Brocadiaceae bacterium]
MKKQLLYFMVLFLLGSNVIAGENELKERLKNLQEEEKKGQKMVVDDSLRRELQDFLVKNQSVSIKDFKKFRLTAKASGVMVRYLNKKYGATEDDYQTKITDKKDRDIYQIALKILHRDYYEDFYICKGDDKHKMKESWEKVSKIKNQISELAKKDKSFDNSDEEIRLREQILEECRFDVTADGLLHAYRVRGDSDDKYRKKYNELMLRMIADDQVNYDYLYKGLDSLNSRFFSQYLYLLHYVNSQHKKLILSKEQVKFIAENVLGKHRELFDMRKYYPKENESYDEHAVWDVIQSMVNLSTWLRDCKLDDLNENIIKRFFDDEFVIKAMRYVPRFKDYLEYLLKREDFQKYREE